jgi:hypothetical protein
MVSPKPVTETIRAFASIASILTGGENSTRNSLARRALFKTSNPAAYKPFSTAISSLVPSGCAHWRVMFKSGLKPSLLEAQADTPTKWKRQILAVVTLRTSRAYAIR